MWWKSGRGVLSRSSRTQTLTSSQPEWRPFARNYLYRTSTTWLYHTWRNGQSPLVPMDTSTAHCILTYFEPFKSVVLKNTFCYSGWNYTDHMTSNLHVLWGGASCNSFKCMVVMHSYWYGWLWSCLVPINWFQYVIWSSESCSDLTSFANVMARLWRAVCTAKGK